MINRIHLLTMDMVNSKKRSWIMAQVKSSGNASTEAALLAIFRRLRIVGWRRKYPLFGKPDFVFPRARVAVFVDGCFWHGHPRKCRLPKKNREYWSNKIARNIARDRLVVRTLKEQGWKVIRIWENCIKDPATSAKLRNALEL